MQKIKFWKMSGAGNDFVLITGRRGTAALKRLAVKLCSRRTGAGTDGLLCVNGAGRGAVSVRYFNSDGSEAFCGNGSRCSALWARANRLAKAGRFTLRTSAGDLEAEVTGRGRVRMSMPDVRGASLRHRGSWPAGVGEVHFLDTGVPHAVVPVKDLERLDVRGLGRALRFHRAFGRGGANVDFVKVSGGTVRVRTYERGVEDETLACGTGITASAVALALDGRVKPPVRLESRGGDVFKVWLNPEGRGASDLVIEGPARMVFQGEIEC